MTVTLNRAYQGYTAGQVVDLPSELEAALVAQKIATSGGTATSGALTTSGNFASGAIVASGYANIAAAASSVVVTIAGLTTQHKAWAVIAQAAADGTATSIPRVNCTANTLTITANAAATAATRVAYFVTL